MKRALDVLAVAPFAGYALGVFGYALTHPEMTSAQALFATWEWLVVAGIASILVWIVGLALKQRRRMIEEFRVWVEEQTVEEEESEDEEPRRTREIL